MKPTLIIKYPTGEVWKEIPDPVKGVCQNGTAKGYHKNGVLKSIGTYVNGLPNGLFQQWDDQGRLLGQDKIEMGTGTVRSWHENGRIEVEMMLVDNIQDGKTTVWDQDGNVIMDDYYIKGKKVSKKKYLQEHNKG